MKRNIFLTITIATTALLLGACSSIDIDRTLAETDQALPAPTRGSLQLARTVEQREQRKRSAEQLLAQPLAMNDAVLLALANSPQLQALLAERWADLADANQSGRLANPLFTFERMRSGSELELGRLLSVGLLDLLTLPRKQSIARAREDAARAQLAATVVEQVALGRQAWVQAVAAQQLAVYAGQVQLSADASAELARRMQQAGNFSRLQRARQQVFYAGATAQLAGARQTALAAREELVRRLGLDDAQAARMQLPERLPDLPAVPHQTPALNAAAMQQRLDWQIARAQLDAAGRSQGLGALDTWLDAGIGVRHDTTFDNATGQRSNRNGFELDMRLPLFDWGDAKRAALDARTLAAANRYDAVTRAASSQLRERYAAYRTSYDVAKHYRDEIVPLRQVMADENVLRYNGMLIGVFELLAETREQIASVMASINALQQFWLADAALGSAVTGQPMTMTMGDAR
ncbi:MAG: TolC family protein [Ramlibacter sp.]|nr:TolC family protein [Ramlibacter sp.]